MFKFRTLTHSTTYLLDAGFLMVKKKSIIIDIFFVQNFYKRKINSSVWILKSKLISYQLYCISIFYMYTYFQNKCPNLSLGILDSWLYYIIYLPRENPIFNEISAIFWQPAKVNLRNNEEVVTLIDLYLLEILHQHHNRSDIARPLNFFYNVAPKRRYFIVVV